MDSYFGTGGDIIADPNNNSIYWAGGDHYNGTAYVMSTTKTTDGGTTWLRDDVGTVSGIVYAMAIDHTNSNVVYAGGSEGGAATIYKTTDSGGNWSKLPCTGLSGTYVNTLAIETDNTNTLFAGGTSNLFKSTDGGFTWSTTGFLGGRTNTIKIVNSALRASTIYAGTSNNGVYRSTDGGNSWAQINDGLGVNNILCLTVSPDQYLFAGTNGGSMYRRSIQIGVQEEKITHIKNNDVCSTIIAGPLLLPEGKRCRVYDISGRTVVFDKIRPGVYFIEVDGQITRKIIKIR